jgi:hypothetical protein
MLETRSSGGLEKKDILLCLLVQIEKILSARDFEAGATEFVVAITATPLAHGLHQLNQTAKAVLPVRPVPFYGLEATIDQARAWLPRTPGNVHWVLSALPCGVVSIADKFRIRRSGRLGPCTLEHCDQHV